MTTAAGQLSAYASHVLTLMKRGCHDPQLNPEVHRYKTVFAPWFASG